MSVSYALNFFSIDSASGLVMREEFERWNVIGSFFKIP